MSVLKVTMPHQTDLRQSPHDLSLLIRKGAFLRHLHRLDEALA